VVVRIVPTPKTHHQADYDQLGRALRELRETAALTQVQAGERAGVRSQFVSEVEHGRRGVTWHTLLALLRAYDADLHNLADTFGCA
jgi:transcriptional regulator with XRE-family HTH domain